MTKYAVKNVGSEILTIPGHTSIRPGNVEVLSGQHKDRLVDNFGDEVEVEEYTPDEDDEESILDGSVSDVEDALDTGDYDDQLGDLIDQEKEGQDRKGAKEAIQSRIEEVEGGG